MLRQLECVSTDSEVFDVSPWKIRVAEARSLLSAAHPNIMPHPDDPNRILRKIDLSGILEPEEQIKIAQAHWANIPNVKVPKASFAVRELRNGRITGFATAEKIVGRDACDILQDPGRTEEEILALRGLASSVDYYFNSVLEEGEPYVLSDLAGLRQFRYGKPQSASSDVANSMYQLDIDPRIAPTSAYRSAGWDNQITEFASWAQYDPVNAPPTVPYSPYGAPDPFATL